VFTARVSVVALLLVLGYFALTAQQPPVANDAPATVMSESPAVESPLPEPRAQIAAVMVAEEVPVSTPSTPQPGVAATEEIAGAPPAAKAGSELQPAIAGIEATVEAIAAPVAVTPIASESSHEPPATVQDPAPTQAAPPEMSVPTEAELEATPPPA
jgi:hypothetical protein